MAFDAHKNLAISTVVTPPAPATSGTALTVTAGEGGRFPAPPFNATVWPASQPPTPANAELVRVTAITGDGLTITRAVEGSPARSIVAGDLIAATITAKVITDIENGTNFPQLGTPGRLTFQGYGEILSNTPDGADIRYTHLGGGGGVGETRGAYLTCFGNEYPGREGTAELAAGNAVNGRIEFLSTGAKRGAIHPSGGFSWGHLTDPGATNFQLLPGGKIGAGPVVVGQPFAEFTGGSFALGVAGTATLTAQAFYNANGQVGSIWFLANSVQYNTTSDARLKTDRGLITDPEVLRSTRVHHFTWNTDGTAGRGVFAQEAIAVLPSAVSIGTDERDDDGRLKNPWGVDYSKYVPDLIAGWQHHDERLAALERLARVDMIPSVPRYGTTDPPPSSKATWFSAVREFFRAWWARPSWV